MSRVFEARLQAADEGDAWTLLPIPVEITQELGDGRVAVKGAINGTSFRSSAFPSGDGTHHVMINKSLRTAAHVRPGDMVRVMIDRDDDPTAVDLPRELEAALAGDAGARTNFERLPNIARKEFARWVDAAKKDDTRAKRADQAINRIRDGKRLKD
jgi:hypothetical protein